MLQCCIGFMHECGRRLNPHEGHNARLRGLGLPQGSAWQNRYRARNGPNRRRAVIVPFMGIQPLASVGRHSRINPAMLDLVALAIIFGSVAFFFGGATVVQRSSSAH